MKEGKILIQETNSETNRKFVR